MGAVLTGSLITHCGACEVTCLSGATCSGECSCPGFPAGHKYCDEDANTGGVTDGVFECIPANDDFNCYACGARCEDISLCDSSARACVCNDAVFDTYCGTSCVNLIDDADHCGACGLACPDGESCDNGGCTCPMDTDIFCNAGDGTYECIDGDTMSSMPALFRAPSNGSIPKHSHPSCSRAAT